MNCERTWAIKRWYMGWSKNRPIFSVKDTGYIDRLFYKEAKNTEYWQIKLGGTFLIHPFPSELYYFEETPFRDNWYPTFFFYYQKLIGDNPESRFKDEHERRFLQLKEIGIDGLKRLIGKRSSPDEFTEKLSSLCEHVCNDNYQNFEEFSCRLMENT